MMYTRLLKSGFTSVSVPGTEWRAHIKGSFVRLYCGRSKVFEGVIALPIYKINLGMNTPVDYYEAARDAYREQSRRHG